MKIFYDAEFLEDGRTIDLISIGMVREDGAEMYAVNDELLHRLNATESSLYGRVCRHDWLMDNVVPRLPLKGPGANAKAIGRTAGGWGFYHLDPESQDVLPRRLIRAKVREFVLAAGHDGTEIELWAWYGAYDHVVLAQLFGRMIDLPEGFPMFTNDVRTLAVLAGPEAIEQAPQAGLGEHNALHDAHYTKTLYAYYARLLDLPNLKPTLPVVDLS